MTYQGPALAAPHSARAYQGLRLLLAAALAAALVTSCSDDGTAGPASTTSDSGPGITMDITTTIDSVEPLPDTAAPSDSADGAPDPDAAGTDQDIDNPLVGSFGAPCSTGEECDSGYCVPSASGSVCSKICENTCPDGYKCTGKQNATGDLVYLCVPGGLSLCDPCTLNADCNDASETGNVCLSFGAEGKFCGIACGTGKPACGKGYTCDSLVDPESGKAIKQCVPEGGKLCTCSAKAASQSKSTACYTKNFYGQCDGTRQCSASGLSDCSAPVPKAEECNSVDDDCNGKTDDFSTTAKCDKKNEFGTCTGKVIECVQGQAICDAPDPKPEACNGKDDDCDGKTDEDLCDDGNPCTLGSCNTDGSCKQAPQSGAACDDGNSCTTTDKCASGNCTGAKVMDCDDSDSCTLDTCDAVTGCTHTAKDGSCTDDGQPCTQDICQGGKCVHPPQSEGGACPDDGEACTQDICQSGKCNHPAQADGGKCLEDSDPCTQDVCKTGKCGHPPVVDNTPCADDGNACTGDVCVLGKCSHPAVSFTVPCADDANPCTADVCDKGGCTHQKLGSDKSCLDDGDPCTQDVCVNGACGHPPATNNAPCMDDGLFCTNDVCNSGKCSHPSSNKPCTDDGNPCTLDVCQSSVCQHPPGNANAPCADDGVLCTNDKCQNGQCAHPFSSGNPCDDGNPCTIGEFCTTGTCKSAGTKVCDDGNPCTADKCVPFQGCLFTNADNLMCDDGNGCTTGDKCLSGQCSGTGTKTCDDGNPCTTDDCAGGCKYTNNTSKCEDDGNPCTNDVCSGGKCGHPTAYENLPCGASTGNPCVEGKCQSGKCNGVSQEGKLCNDSDACTSNDKCTGGICKGSAFKNCDDGNPCTADSCDQYGTCVHKSADGQSCVSPSGDCPSGQCVAGSCQSKSGVTCQAEYDVDLCASVKVPGTCSANGKCVANQGQSGFTCPGCNGVCLQCTIFGGIQLKYCLGF